MKAKTTRRALLMSALSLLLCVSMLIGTTFAWFTDSVTSANNIIASGNLDVELYWAEGTEDPTTTNWKDASQGAIFDYDLWEPGYVCVRHVKIENKGTLALKYMMAIEANGEVSDLAKVIDVYYLDPAVQISDRQDLANLPLLGTLDQVLSKLDQTAAGTLTAGNSDVVTIALKMQESAGNEYMNMSIGTDFSIKLFATQLTSELDSFDNQYDAGAYLPVVYNADELRQALADGESVRLGGTIDGDATEPVFSWGAAYTTEYMVMDVDLSGGNIVLDEGAKYGMFLYANQKPVTISDTTITSTSQFSIYGYTADKTVTLNNVNIEAEKGAGYYLYGTGTSVLNNVQVNHKALDDAYAASTPWAATALAASNGHNLVVNSGTYVGSTTAVYLYSSGGVITINGGSFKAPVVVACDAQNGANSYININGGNFDGKFESVNVWGGSTALITINGGNFTNFSTSANKRITIKGGTFDADPTQWLATGYKAVSNGDGTWTVVEKSAYEKEGYTEVSTSAGNIAAALDMTKDTAAVLSAGETSTAAIALDFTGSSDNNFAILGENTVFTGDLQISSHANFHLGDNAQLVIDGITVNGTLSVVAYYKNIIIRNVKAESITVHDGGNVTIENCTLDGASDNGLYVVATANNYNLTLKDNTIRNSAKNAVQISGCAMGATYGAGTITVTGNTFENWCTKNDKPRAGFKVWGDSVLAPTSGAALTAEASALVAAIENGGNTFIGGNANQVTFDFYDNIF